MKISSGRMQARKKEFREAVAPAAHRVDGIEPEVPDDEDFDQFVAETIVREGRPALLVQRDATFSGTDADNTSKPIIDRLKAATGIVEQLLPKRSVESMSRTIPGTCLP